MAETLLPRAGKVSKRPSAACLHPFPVVKARRSFTSWSKVLCGYFFLNLNSNRSAPRAPSDNVGELLKPCKNRAQAS